MRNPVLERIFETEAVNDRGEAISLRHPEFPEKFSHVGRSTGELLQRAVADVQPRVSLEIGLGRSRLARLNETRVPLLVGRRRMSRDGRRGRPKESRA